MSRPDQSITFLRQFGYSVFRMPRPGAQPLDLLHRDGKDLTRLGGALDLIAPGAVQVPTIHRDDRPGVAIEGTESSKVNIAIGLNILGGFLGALGGANLGLQSGFQKAKTVNFKYSAVTEDNVDVLALERFIHAGRISDTSRQAPSTRSSTTRCTSLPPCSRPRKSSSPDRERRDRTSRSTCL